MMPSCTFPILVYQVLVQSGNWAVCSAHLGKFLGRHAYALHHSIFPAEILTVPERESAKAFSSTQAQAAYDELGPQSK